MAATPADGVPGVAEALAPNWLNGMRGAREYLRFCGVKGLAAWGLADSFMARLRSVTDITFIERSGEQEWEMAMRIILASGCLAIGAAVIALTGTATRATTLSGAQSPTPTPSATFTPTISPTVTVTSSATATVTASATATVTAFPTAVPVPTAAPVTGGGGSIIPGGSDTPLVAGGAAATVAGAGLGLLAFRRWRRDRVI